MTRREKKISLIVISLLSASCVVGLVLYALKESIDLYFTPTQIVQNEVPEKAHFRVGGMVKKGSVRYGHFQQAQSVSFILTDTQNEITVYFKGILPDLFREGQGIVADGHLSTNKQAKKSFIADEVLAKHDENYMPPQIDGEKISAQPVTSVLFLPPLWGKVRKGGS